VTDDTGSISDGYHTFDELYEHRHALFLTVMQQSFLQGGYTWVDLDPNTPGWFLAGIDTDFGQVSYHLPIRLLEVATKYEREDYTRQPYNGHTSDDVLRLLQFFIGHPEGETQT